MSHFDNFVGTREVSDAHRFDTQALTHWLQDHMPGFEGPLEVEMFKGGQSNPTYKLNTAKAMSCGPNLGLLPNCCLRRMPLSVSMR